MAIKVLLVLFWCVARNFFCGANIGNTTHRSLRRTLVLQQIQQQ